MSGQKRPTGFDPARAVAQARFRALSEAGQGDIFTAALESRPAAAGATVPTAETRRAAAPGAVEKPAEAGAPRKFQPTEVRTSELSFHAPFQNRASVTARGEFVDEEGIQQFLRDAGGKFDPDGGGRITVWKDNLGEIGERGRSYVLDGHHRVVLAASDWQLENGRYVSKGPVDRPMDAVRFRGNYQEALAFSRDANRGGRPNTYAETSASRSVSEEVGGALSRLIGEAPFEARIPRAAAAPVAPSTRIVPPAKPPRKRPPAPPAGGEPPDADAALKRIRAALRAAPALQREQKAIFRKVRGQVAAKMRSVRERVPGEAGVRERFRVMKTGPIERVQFESLRGKIAQVDVDALVDRINTHPKLAGEYDRQNAAVGLLKLFGQHGGAVPTDSELALLREVYGSDFVKDVLAKRPLIEKAWEASVEVLNLPRALMATGDLSAPFRQGVVFVGAPKEFTRALGTMARAALSERKYVDALDRIKLRRRRSDARWRAGAHRSRRRDRPARGAVPLEPRREDPAGWALGQRLEPRLRGVPEPAPRRRLRRLPARGDPGRGRSRRCRRTDRVVRERGHGSGISRRTRARGAGAERAFLLAAARCGTDHDALPLPAPAGRCAEARAANADRRWRPSRLDHVARETRRRRGRHGCPLGRFSQGPVPNASWQRPAFAHRRRPRLLRSRHADLWRRDSL